MGKAQTEFGFDPVLNEGEVTDALLGFFVNPFLPSGTSGSSSPHAG